MWFQNDENGDAYRYMGHCANSEISVTIQHQAGRHIVRKVSHPGKVSSINRCVLIFSALQFLCPVVSGSMINMCMGGSSQAGFHYRYLASCVHDLGSCSCRQ